MAADPSCIYDCGSPNSRIGAIVIGDLRNKIEAHSYGKIDCWFHGKEDGFVTITTNVAYTTVGLGFAARRSN